jgi:hypothetical protein
MIPCPTRLATLLHPRRRRYILDLTCLLTHPCHSIKNSTFPLHDTTLTSGHHQKSPLTHLATAEPQRPQRSQHSLDDSDFLNATCQCHLTTSDHPCKPNSALLSASPNTSQCHHPNCHQIKSNLKTGINRLRETPKLLTTHQ